VMPGVGHFFHGRLPQLRELLVRQWHATLEQPARLP
jgi:alpha/beta superfamily hydrolase